MCIYCDDYRLRPDALWNIALAYYLMTSALKYKTKNTTPSTVPKPNSKNTVSNVKSIHLL
jgi:hypothetical protein